ncbi:MAG: hypothetical protein AB1589_01500 [Cyanobacteriota bacterium]
MSRFLLPRTYEGWLNGKERSHLWEWRRDRACFWVSTIASKERSQLRKVAIDVFTV